MSTSAQGRWRKRQHGWPPPSPKGARWSKALPSSGIDFAALITCTGRAGQEVKTPSSPPLRDEKAAAFRLGTQHSPAVDERYRTKLMQRTGEERLMMGCAMRDAARALMEASFLEQDPRASIATLRQGLFLRLYGHEFDAETRTRILAAIQEAALLASR